MPYAGDVSIFIVIEIYSEDDDDDDSDYMDPCFNLYCNRNLFRVGEYMT